MVVLSNICEIIKNCKVCVIDSLSRQRILITTLTRKLYRNLFVYYR